MNDTFDYFAVSQIEHFVNENLSNTQGNKRAQQDISDLHNSISFDDSIFLENYNSQIFKCVDEDKNGLPKTTILLPKEEVGSFENLSECDQIEIDSLKNSNGNIRNSLINPSSESDQALKNRNINNEDTFEEDKGAEQPQESPCSLFSDSTFLENYNSQISSSENQGRNNTSQKSTAVPSSEQIQPLEKNTKERNVSQVKTLMHEDNISEDSMIVENNKGDNITKRSEIGTKIDIQENTDSSKTALSLDSYSDLYKNDESRSSTSTNSQKCNIPYDVSSCLVDPSIKNIPSNVNGDHLLSAWGLPDLVLKSYKKRNITTMFDWQLECLSKDGLIKENKNLVYSAPTSAGKTLVSEILAMKCLFERKKKVIFILPFISVVREKMYYFQDILDSSGKRVEGFMGSYNPPGGFESVQMAVGTIEKCNSLVNRLVAEGKLGEIGLVIIDEIHLIGDPHRGYLLELLLTKLKYVMYKNQNVKIQIVGMSATLPNLDLLAKWLDAELYTTNFRPIPLREMVYVNGELYNNEFKLLRRLAPLPELTADTDDILQLCLETIENSCSVLIFCPTKNWCENLAQQIAMAFWRIGRSGSELSKILHKNLSVEKITEVLEQLKYCPSGLDKILKNTVAFGVAFHHAGLTMEERDIIEGGFRSGGVRLLIATSTLSSGVNLPVRRVIIRSPLFNGRPMDTLTYRQMIGRAGRMGIDTEGQSILICQKSDYNTAKLLTQFTLKPVQSCLKDVGKFKRAILEIIASGVASTPEDVNIFEKCTLISIQNSDSAEKVDPVIQVVEFLKNFQFIRLQTLEDGTCKYSPTALGKACLTSSLPPGEGLELFNELEKARQCFVLETELHLIYLVTPYSACYQWSNIDWMFYLDLWEKLPLSMKKVGELVGVRESFIINATRGKLPDSPKLLIHKRFFVALALQDLVNEKSLDEVAAKFSCNRGMLQSLQQSASTFAGMVTSFTRQLGWSSVEILISQFQDRLQFGVNRDLLDLMRLPCLNSKQARAFYNAGIETMIQLANSDVCTIENILYKVIPFENIKEREGETEYEFKQRNKLRTIWITGKQGLNEKEAATLILKDAREYLECEMGVKNIKWGSAEDSPENCETSLTSPVNESITKENQSNSKTLSQRNLMVDHNSSFKLVLTEINNRCSSSTPKVDKVVDISMNNKENIVKSSSSPKEYTPSMKQNLSIDLKKFDSLKIRSPQSSIQTISSDTTQSYSPLNKSINLKKCLYTSKSQVGNDISNLSENTGSGSNETGFGSLSEDDLFHESLEETIEKVSTLTVDSKKRISDSRASSTLKKQKTVHESNTSEDAEVSRFDDFTMVKDQITTPIDLSKFYIIDVCKYEKLYQCFREELLKQPNIAISLACRVIEDLPTIGRNLSVHEKNNYKYHFENKKVNGVALTWDGKNVFFLYLDDDDCDEKLKTLQKCFGNKNTCVKMFDSKECIVMLSRALDVDVSTRIQDPKILDWLLDPDGKEKNLHSMIAKYCPEAKGLSLLVENCRGYGCLGMNTDNTIEPRMRAAVEVVVTWTLMTELNEMVLERSEILSNTYDIEMAATHSISNMEIAGIGIDRAAMESIVSSIKSNVYAIERKIYSLAGRKFSITSSKEVAKVIGLRTSRQISTKKQILEQSKHPISDLILLWRKLSFTLSKTLQPLLAAVKNNRIYGKCIMHTATGRISMHEPNLQNVAKNFEFINPITNETVCISCRSIFVPRNGCVFLSADYCQLELRMLAHLSRDELLCKILKSEGDIFKSIAAKWNRISEDLVTDVLRTQTKQICYGIIYGIGSKALAEQLKIEVNDAALFMENFKNTYPAIKTYIQSVVNSCRSDGFVETLSGRRRTLSLIENENPAIRSHAERQAVNSTIQGSAADLVKRAMKKLQENFDSSLEPTEKPVLVLHLHDELLFEVDKRYLYKIARLVKETMESSVNLSVPFPVKLKAGNSWGNLVEQCDIY